MQQARSVQCRDSGIASRQARQRECKTGSAHCNAVVCAPHLPNRCSCMLRNAAHKMAVLHTDNWSCSAARCTCPLPACWLLLAPAAAQPTPKQLQAHNTKATALLLHHAAKPHLLLLHQRTAACVTHPCAAGGSLLYTSTNTASGSMRHTSSSSSSPSQAAEPASAAGPACRSSGSSCKMMLPLLPLLPCCPYSLMRACSSCSACACCLGHAWSRAAHVAADMAAPAAARVAAPSSGCCVSLACSSCSCRCCSCSSGCCSWGCCLQTHSMIVC